jgi:hypothetical protein
VAVLILIFKKSGNAVDFAWGAQIAAGTGSDGGLGDRRNNRDDGKLPQQHLLEFFEVSFDGGRHGQKVKTESKNNSGVGGKINDRMEPVQQYDL